MVFEIISGLIIVDSVIALIISFTKVGDETIEKHPLVRRYMPLTTGGSVLYFLLALYIAYLTFFVV